MDFSSYTTLSFKRRDRVLEVTLNRPEAANAVNETMHTELSRLFPDLADDRESDVIVISGAGKYFSAGGDVELLKRASEDPAYFEFAGREGKRIIMSMLDLKKPVITKLNGTATGLGATIALFSDIIFANESAKIGDPHVRMGLAAGDGGALIWPQLIGYARAKHYLLTGDLIPAKEAAQIGLINFALAPEVLDTRVDEFADRLANGATLAISWTKLAINAGLKQIACAIIDQSIEYECRGITTDDHKEAVNAFIEKRKPVFTGR